ncbi:MAG: 50S ribosomal protein L4 [Alphaproteobacteria bacterium]|nr:50S ribosomal protein L4 [Alphaproteobacteria bacterium]MCK5518788.1 50S ribosomal protein L4 [Alphaproteobacteria bacterium]MCK5556670.1 50S ribosomal protein L4 [Alphaproteobacteria bacterium]MCK5659159.1 50S ribosomal protein L4 [Alphaproteobacteria bacterium]
MKVAVKSLDNKSVGDIDLSEDVFGLSMRRDVLHRMVNWQLAKRRSGNHKTKGINEVSGTGKKPFAQKGSGRARASSLRNIHHRGGAVMFGPLVRSHAINMPKNFRKLALRVALSSKQAEGKLIILDEAKAVSHKTKDMVKTFAGLGLTSALIIDEVLDQGFTRAAGNIPNVDVLPQKGINVYDIMRRDTLVLTKDAITQLEARLK